MRSISRLPPRTFLPFTSSGTRTGVALRLATPPACQSHVTRTAPFSAIRGHLLADLGLLLGIALRVGADHARHEADVVFADFAAVVVQRIERHVQSAAADRGVLRHGLDQGGIRIDLAAQRALGALLELDREAAAHLVAEITRIGRAAGELVGDLELLS